MSKSNNNKQKAEPTRRSFLNIIWIVLGGVALAELVAVAFAFLRPRKSKPEAENTDSIVTAGAVERFTPNSVTAFVRGKFYLARLEDGGFLALSRTCTHLGCRLNYNEEEHMLICPCHKSKFTPEGKRVSGPAERDLESFKAEKISGDQAKGYVVTLRG